MGNSSTSNSPWPLSSAADNRLTQVARRYEYTSHICPDNLETGGFCISEWDILPGSLPAEHKHLHVSLYVYMFALGLGSFFSILVVSCFM